MKRLIGFAVSLTLLSGCSPNGPTPGGNPGATNPTQGSSGSTETIPPNSASPTPLPSPSDPGAGGGKTSKVGLKREAAGSDPSNQTAPERPLVLLARTPEEAATVGQQAPPGARAFLSGWGDFAHRALIAVIGGAQPDTSYRVRVDQVSIFKGAKILQVTGAIVTKGQGTAQTTTPWTILSVNLPTTLLVKRCDLAFEGQTLRQFDC